MPVGFTVLASGSLGNASLVVSGQFGVLLDAGLGPRQLAVRLAALGLSWRHIHAALLTHTHGDHWNDRTLAHLRRLRIPLYCHPRHHELLLAAGEEFGRLRKAMLVRSYEEGTELYLAPNLRCRPLLLFHYGGATFGFRFDGSADPDQRPWSIGYLADLGSWTAALARAVVDVDLLALEFNHDVDLELASGRSPQLIARVLGDGGHLSNAQAAALLHEILDRSSSGRLQHLVQLHLSHDCNHVSLAAAAARTVLNGRHNTIQLHTASQDQPGPMLLLNFPGHERKGAPTSVDEPALSPAPDSSPGIQLWLPGWD
jgi:phosphoribosyl 1,2-cyclic phosphodiesterase